MPSVSGDHIAPPSPTILLVEDDEYLGYLLEYLLTREGYRVTRLLDGQQGQQYIAQQPPPCLAVLDIMLPYQSGLQLLERIRSQEGWREVPVIVMSAISADNDIAWALDHGADDYITKPLQPPQFIARVRSHLRHNPQCTADGHPR